MADREMTRREMACRIYYYGRVTHTILEDFELLWRQRYHGFLMEGITDDFYISDVEDVMSIIRELFSLFNHKWESTFFKKYPTVEPFLAEFAREETTDGN